MVSIIYTVSRKRKGDTLMGKWIKIIVGIALIFGSVGAIDMGNISMARFVIQELVGVYSLISGVAHLYTKVRY